MRATAAFLALLAALSVLTRVDAAADVAVLELVGASFAAADAADADARGTTRVVRCVARQNASSSELRVVALAATLPPNRAPVAGTLVPAGDGVVLGAWPRDADALECVLFEVDEAVATARATAATAPLREDDFEVATTTTMTFKDASPRVVVVVRCEACAASGSERKRRERREVNVAAAVGDVRVVVVDDDDEEAAEAAAAAVGARAEASTFAWWKTAFVVAAVVAAVEAVALLSLIFRRRVGDPAGGRGRRAVKRKHSDFPTNAEEVVAEDAETSAVVTDDGSRAATRRTCCFVV